MREIISLLPLLCSSLSIYRVNFDKAIFVNFQPKVFSLCFMIFIKDSFSLFMELMGKFNFLTSYILVFMILGSFCCVVKLSC